MRRILPSSVQLESQQPCDVLIITNHVARSFRTHFARHLPPFNFAVGIDGGMDFIVKATQLAIKKYIYNPHLLDKAPSRCLVSLDLKNMFNKISQETIFEVIESKFPELMPLVSMLYNKPGTVFYKMADGLWYNQLMEEGVNQGCPLSATLAAIVLNEVLVPIKTKLQARAWSRFHA